ncbi:cytochrome P450 302a1, mitochondrial-like [Ischnura elegans]|uniref:cytochrome P450 302a1, mitochondrial-like n=1 Tax=Ischnura elegans TaxID=197161 RepID=UPI001ED877E3|nr:cytochrome P450 302a1, mitochondrial-like [Ischnura elegans]
MVMKYLPVLFKKSTQKCGVILGLSKSSQILFVRGANSVVKEKPFQDIPGPKSLPVIGTLWKYIPYIGKYRWDRLHHNGFLKLEEFGPLVREEVVPGVNVIWLFDPDDVEHLFRVEGRFPCRRSHLALEKYRLDRPEIYKCGGLLPTNGQEWWRLRSAFQKDLSRLPSVRSYLPNTNAVLQEFISHTRDIYVKTDQDCGSSIDQSPKDFLESISCLFLELTCLVAFDVRMGSLSSFFNEESLAKKLIQAALDSNSCILSTDNGPQLWRFFETPLYKKLRESQEVMERVAVEFVSLKKEEMKGKDPSEYKSLLEIYMSTPGLDEKDVVGMAMDMLLAGIDTATYTAGFCLYHLAVNEEKQNNLFEEAVKLLPFTSGAENACSLITEEVLAQSHYVKAVLKESLRLNPVSVGIGRVLPCDTVFSGYMVPKGTVVVTQNQVSCRLEKYFSQPNSFIPERWIRGSAHYQQPVSPYLLLPFGHGPRTCIARRLAEQNIQALLLSIVRNFEIHWLGKPNLDCLSLLINKPDQPLLFEFIPRKSVLD